MLIKLGYMEDETMKLKVPFMLADFCPLEKIKKMSGIY